MKEVEQTSEQAKQAQVNIQAQYVKNISFDSPIVPRAFKEIKEAPKVDLNLDIQVKDIEKDQYEVTIVIKAKAEHNTDKVFSVDMEYSGLFEIKSAPSEEQKKQILLIYCPNIIFPFARRIVSDVTRDAGFQPLMINPVDFAGLYMQQQQKQQDSSSTVH